VFFLYEKVVALKKSVPMLLRFSSVYTAKRVAAAQLNVHKRRAAKFSRKMTEIKGKRLIYDTVTAVLIEYMQNLSLPSIPVQKIFYQRQLTIYVFNIHDFKFGTAKF
jgi:hypothetical protein